MAEIKLGMFSHATTERKCTVAYSKKCRFVTCNYGCLYQGNGHLENSTTGETAMHQSPPVMSNMPITSNYLYIYMWLMIAAHYQLFD